LGAIEEVMILEKAKKWDRSWKWGAGHSCQ